VTSPAELDCLRKPLLIGHVMQAERSADKTGLRAATRHRHEHDNQCERA
jgi:hypothetical protein